jgi:hypothetical protein
MAVAPGVLIKGLASQAQPVGVVMVLLMSFLLHLKDISILRAPKIVFNVSVTATTTIVNIAPHRVVG